MHFSEAGNGPVVTGSVPCEPRAKVPTTPSGEGNTPPISASYQGGGGEGGGGLCHGESRLGWLR